MRPRIIPTVFAKGKRDFDKRFKLLQPISRQLQIDFMDGRLVKNKSVKLQYIPKLTRYKNYFEAHLMVKQPEKWIPQLGELGFDRVIFHVESQKSATAAKKIIVMIRDIHMEPIIAINPDTPLSKIYPLLDDVNTIQCMGVHPGKEGQSLSPSTIRKIKALRNRAPRLHIQVDGGVSNETIRQLARAGADRFSTGSFVARSLDPEAAIRSLRKEAAKGMAERDLGGLCE